MKVKALILSTFLAVSAIASGYDVAAIIWPAYQPEPRWKELGIFKHGCGEWQNVYEAKPKFKGHKQPIVPLWGYERDDDPIAVARKIDAALASGVNVFMYDWYWYQGRPFLENALNEGFLKAPNNERMKFFIMWANHHVDSMWNNKINGKPKFDVIWEAYVDYDEFTKVLVPRWLEYFKKPNYYKINNKPVLAIFEAGVFVRGMGSPEKAKQALEFLRQACKKAGFDGFHFMSMSYKGEPDAPLPNNDKPDGVDIAKYYGFDSMSMYNWPFPWLEGYEKWRADAMAQWLPRKEKYGVYFPHVSSGWDNNPRYPMERTTAICKGSSPAEFEKSLRMAKDWADKNIPSNMPKLIFINAWNEWTEGEYLEPNTRDGYGYLNAIARVFGSHGQATK